MTLQVRNFGVLTLAVAAAACTGSINDTSPSGTDSSGVNNGAGGSVTSPPGASGSPTTGPGAGGAASVPQDGSTSGSTPGSDGASVSGQLNLQGSPKFFRVVRLTNEQWTNSVKGVLALSTAPAQAEAFQSAVSGTTDFTNNELVLDVDSRGWSDYQAAAEAIAAQVTDDQAQLTKVYSGSDAAGFINTVGRRFYRRPLTSTETAGYQKLFDLGSAMSATKSAFAKGAAAVLEAMLQSPFFLYRTELGAVGAPLSGYEMAAKLALWLRNTSPDDALLDAAKSGSLDTVDGAVATAQKMLDEPGAKAVMRRFHGEFLHFDRFANLSKVGVANFNPTLNPELAESSYLFFDRIFSQGLGVKDIFTSTKGYVGANMAPLYGGGVAASGNGLEERDLGANRAGYFLQLPFLVLYSHNADPDSIHRGVTISLDVLCAPLGPPANVIPPLPAAKPGQTNRMRVDEHTKACGLACHNQMINPLGFAFENYDGMGQYRQTETNGSESLPIDSSGAFVFVDGKKTWNNGAELMSLLASDPQTHLCYAKKLASYGLQRDVVAADMPLLNELAATSASTSGSVKQVILALVKQSAFRTRVGGTP